MADLHLAARVGDLARVKYCVERGYDINAINEYQVSPLYNAALCGHTEVVKYLLDNGAVAEEGDFMSERCFYAALTDDLRRLLKSYKLSNAYRNPFLESLRTLYEERSSRFPDIHFRLVDEEEHDGGAVSRGRGPQGSNDQDADSVGGIGRVPELLPCHRVILRSRSPYFRKNLKARWRNARRILLRHQVVSSRAFAAVVQYLYTGRLELPTAYVRDCVVLSKKLELTHLRWRLREKFEQQGSRWGSQGRIILEPRVEDVAGDYRTLAQDVLRRFSEDADVLVHCDGRHFALHKVLLSSRSDYFKTLFCSGFQEAVAIQHHSQNTALPTIEVHDLSHHAFKLVLEYVYSDQLSEPLGLPIVFEVLDAATRFLLSGLRNLCVAALIEHANEIEPFSLHSLALLYELPRLENHCLMLFAERLDEVINQPEFAKLVEESAYSIEKREETDSIPFVDDVRSHICHIHRRWEPHDMERKLAMIDELLDRLQLSA